MNDLQTISTAVLKPKPLTGSAKIVYELLTDKFQRKETLTLKELIYVWADTMIPDYQFTKVGGYNSKGKWEIKEVNRNKWVKEAFETRGVYNGSAIQWLKYHIGNLVLNGYAVMIPIINFDIQQQKQIEDSSEP